jgi:putative acetyltransferase
VPVSVRIAAPADLGRILRVTEEAFGSRVEAELVRLIHDSPGFVPELSLVAEKDGCVVGHVMLSYVHLEDDGARHRVLSLAPLSVARAQQRHGVGTALVREAVRRADERSEPLVILEGSPAYYGRLGFTDARDAGIRFDLPDWAPPNAGQVCRLTAYDATVRGSVVYPPAFAQAEALRER